MPSNFFLFACSLSFLSKNGTQLAVTRYRYPALLDTCQGCRSRSHRGYGSLCCYLFHSPEIPQLNIKGYLKLFLWHPTKQILRLHQAERCPWCQSDWLMVLSASPVSISVPSLFQEAHTNLSIVVGVQRSRFICQYKLCVALLKLIIVVPSSFAWHLINCSIVKVCIRLSDHSCAWCERQETNHQSHQNCTYELCMSCVSCHVCERGGPWDNSPVVATGNWGKEDLPFVCALLNNSKMR